MHLLTLRTFSLLFILPFLTISSAQSQKKQREFVPGSLHLDAGTADFQTTSFNLRLLKSSQTVSRLSTVTNPDFDYTPGESIRFRNQDGFYQLGDLNLQLKTGTGEWKAYSSATRRADILPLKVTQPILAAANMKPTFDQGMPLDITRSWEEKDGDLILRFLLKNSSDSPVTIGALGIPMIFNNNLSDKTLEEAHAKNVFFDPYTGKDAGYLQVVKLDGNGPALLVLPEENAGFEAYNPLNDDPTRRGITFEGFHEWLIHSEAYAKNEWKNATPWNLPTAVTLQPGTTRDIALRFTLAPSVRDIENTLHAKERPVAIGIPGYVLPKDVKARLFLQYSQEVKSITVFPEQSLSWTNDGLTPHGWQAYTLQGKIWGRARLTITYEDGVIQTIHYKVIKPETEVVADLGHFLTTEQWYENPDDPFFRSPSVISYDYEKKMQVTQDSRAWIAGLSDEGGAGGWLAAIMKEEIEPNATEVDKMEQFMQTTLWGHLQYSEGEKQYGVRKSLFYYAPDKMPPGTYSDSVNYNTWAAWNQEEAESPGRSYNYPHVTAAYWSMYRLARYHQGLVQDENWQWYLEHAFHTAMAMVNQAPYYAQFGQMEGTIFYLLLKDLQKEGLAGMANELEQSMKSRADVWKSLAYPFGSEMPWDSTGQEEVYVWSSYFGYNEKAKVTLNAILAYMPTIPHWGYNGSARRYWDFLYGGKLQRVERQLHHYGSALNAIPVLMAYREHPDDFYLLRVGYGGLMGAISNITEDGFGPAAFHSYPSKLEIDGYSGDYGTGFFGYAVNTAAYLYQHEEFDWLGFGGNITTSGDNVTLHVTTAAKSKIYLAPEGLWLTLDAGAFQSVTYDPEKHTVTVTLLPKSINTSKAYLHIEHPVKEKAFSYALKKNYPEMNGAFVIKLGSKPETFTLQL